MMIKVVEKILRSPWTWRQALTARPHDLNAPISDLFIWRNSAEWQTSFELIDIPRLFVDSEGDESKSSIPRNESDESIKSTNSEPICGSSLDYFQSHRRSVRLPYWL